MLGEDRVGGAAASARQVVLAHGLGELQQRSVRQRGDAGGKARFGG